MYDLQQDQTAGRFCKGMKGKDNNIFHSRQHRLSDGAVVRLNEEMQRKLVA
jgi:hypothetical protein